MIIIAAKVTTVSEPVQINQAIKHLLLRFLLSSFSLDGVAKIGKLSPILVRLNPHIRHTSPISAWDTLLNWLFDDDSILSTTNDGTGVDLILLTTNDGADDDRFCSFGIH